MKRRRLQYAQEEALEQGREIGREEGKLFGEIRILQELLGIEQATDDQLAGYDLTKLKALSQRLRTKPQNRPK